MSGNLLVLSGHDFRSDRRTGVHFVTEAAKTYFTKRSFFSLGYSFISKMKGDPRALLGDRVNKWETHDGVKSYLWDTGLHPFNLKIPIVQQAMAYLYKLYAVLPCRQLDQAIESADVVMLESGLAPMFIPRIRAVSPTTRIIYFASDLLETIGVHPIVERTLQKNLARVDLIRIPARAIAPAFQSQSAKVRHAPHGVSVDQLTQPMVSPYRGTRRTICSAGSMLFDPSYFSAVAPLFDDVDFYIIGSGYKGDLGGNVKLLDEMTFDATLPYVRFSDAVVAPYRESTASSYLAETSLKLLQASFYGIPSICPHFAVGDDPLRHGYTAGNGASAIAATRAALGTARVPVMQNAPTWDRVAEQLFA